MLFNNVTLLFDLLSVVCLYLLCVLNFIFNFGLRLPDIRHHGPKLIHLLGPPSLQFFGVDLLLNSKLNHLLSLCPSLFDSLQSFVFFDLKKLDPVVQLSNFIFSVNP